MFERRMAVAGLEFRDDSSTPTLTGYASTYDQPYDMGWYRESVATSAFKRTLGANPDVRLLINHEGLPLARTTSGTLVLDSDSRGLRVSASLDPSDPDVQALLPKMKRGDLNQMSFGFRTIEDEWSSDMSQRTLRSLDLNDGDVSVVTYPANPNTSVAARAAGAHLDAITSALRVLEVRSASPDDVAAVLTRALSYFSGPDLAVEATEEATAEAEPTADADEAARSAALVALELRKARLRLLG